MSSSQSLAWIKVVMEKLIEIVEKEAKILANPIMLMLQKEIKFEEKVIKYLQDEDVATAVS